MNISNAQPEEAHISDFGLAAAMVTSGFGIRRTERIGSRVFFIFAQTDDFVEAQSSYWSGLLKVYARQHFDNTKMLKSLIYNQSSAQ
jgi:hypothetical protein